MTYLYYGFHDLNTFINSWFLLYRKVQDRSNNHYLYTRMLGMSLDDMICTFKGIHKMTTYQHSRQ